MIKITNNINKYIFIKGAKTHNLRDINLKIPKNKFIVISGVSGSGKSSLAFDTLFAEGQRRYIESLSSYARQFLGKIQKPTVDEIIGICPAVAIEQKTITNNPRSTVGTSTEIYDYLKLLFARIGKTFSPISGKEVKKDNINDIKKFIQKQRGDNLVFVLISLNINHNLNNLFEQGFSRILIKNKIFKIKDLADDLKIDFETAFLVIDRFINNEENINNDSISDSIEKAISKGKGECYIKVNNTLTKFSNKFELDQIIFEEPDINLFSFNSPYGACKTCEGFGSVLGIDEDKVVKNKNLSLFEGAVSCWNGPKLKIWKERFITNSLTYNFPIHRAYNQLSVEEKELLWNGKEKCKGINQFFQKLEKDKYKIQNRILISKYRGKTECTDCKGSRLRKEALYVKICNINIAQLCNMSIKNVLFFINNIKLNKSDYQISKRLIDEIKSRLIYLNDIGLGYLTLNRESRTLSGGESQRINLAKSISSSLVGSMYILDEPSIGLHPNDTSKLIKILQELKEIGNTVIVVEHDEDIIKSADHLIDLGPYAGKNGGKIVFQGIPSKKVKSTKKSLTLKYLTKELSITNKKKSKISDNRIIIKNIQKNNIKNINISIPTDGLTLITGVSGSGKSTLLKSIVKPAIDLYLGNSFLENKSFDKILINDENLKELEFVNQKPIGRSSRSNPVTYIKAYDEIRNLFSQQPLAKARNYKSGFFSFNVPGGRCEECQGEGEIKVEMQFLADIHIICDKCDANRFKKEILEIKFHDLNISDILNLTVDDSILFFNEKNQHKIAKKLKRLQDVGLGYIKLGQSSNTLSGGEAQRIKLAYFLSKEKKQNKTIFMFDEPTTGLHFHDINKLLSSFNKLIENGHSIICIEHNLDVIKCADWIIDLGPKGGEQGGKIIFEGTPEEIIKSPTSLTGKYLKNKI
ncbi:MAG: excinuclease ABC subunit A [Flavobacteriales bacterium]|nr:excinuclease ABC subunit A [Flavobacteriales bacterium]